ncbi:MAG: DUF58 domain-containing protein [Lachnospiraceae bacterium]|nr:DUF58 domain-containing protein [Lachnospiraceae bacterium]
MEDIIKILVVLLLEGAALLLILVGITLLYEVLRALGIKKLEYKRYFSEVGVFEGESLEMIEEVTNHAFFPMLRVDVESYVTSKIRMEGCEERNEVMQHFVSRFPVVMPFTTIRRKHPCKAEKRGYYRLESAKMMFADYDMFLQSEAELYIYPRELSLQEEETFHRYLQYNAASKLPIIADRFAFAGVREYRTTDALGAVNFKATAKYGQLMVNEPEYLMGRQVKIYVNFEPADGLDLNEFRERMERALNYVSHAFTKAFREGNRFGFGANCRTETGDYYSNVPLGTGFVHYTELLKELAKVQSYFGNSFVSVIDMDLYKSIRCAEVYLLTSYVDEGIENRIERLQQLGNTVRVVQV